MTTVDAHGNTHTSAGAPGAGQFSGRVNTAPSSSLSAPPSPEEQAQAIIGRPAPEGASEDAREVWAAVRTGLADAISVQPLSWVAFQAHQRAEAARSFAERRPSELASLRAHYADELADELHAAAGTHRYPQRDDHHVGDDSRDPETVERDVLAGVTSTVHPVGLTATRKAVRHPSNTADGSRRVILSWDSVPAASSGEPLQVVGPAVGAPLVLDVQSGCPTMRVTSGYAVIIDNGSGFGIEAADGAHVTVISGAGRKTSITAQPGSTVDFHPSSDSRGYQRISAGAAFRMHGRADKITLSSDRSSS